MFRIVTGSLISILGLVFFVGGILEQEGSVFIGIFFLIIGIAILLNTKEDKIEQIKSKGNKKHE